MNNQSTTEDDSGFLWVTNGTAWCESLWMGVQRFMYLNDLSGDDFLYLVKRRFSLDRYPSRGLNQKPFVSTTYGYEWDAVWPWLDELHANADVYRTGRYSDCVSTESPLKYCAECLAHCFHADLFQFPTVMRCPHHGAELRTSCPHCGENLSCLGFIPARHPKPFCCTSCGAPYVPTNQVTQRVLFGLPEARDDLIAAHELAAKMARVNVACAEGLTVHDMSGDGFVRFHCHALHAVATHGATKPEWLIGLNDNVTCRAISPSQSDTSSSVERKEQEKRLLLSTQLASLLRILRSIDRHLSREVRSICGHRRPRKLRDKMRSIPWARSRCCLEFVATDCPCCAVLAWWRASFGGYFAFYEWVLQRPLTLLLMEEKRWVELIFPIEANQLILVALDIFASLALQMAYRLESNTTSLLPVHRALSMSSRDKKNLTMNQHWLREDLVMQRDGNGNLELDFFSAYFVAPHLRCVDASEQEFSLSYSMKNAMEALIACHALRQAGPLWRDTRVRFPSDSGDVKDQWFRTISRTRHFKDWHADYATDFRMRMRE